MDKIKKGTLLDEKESKIRELFNVLINDSDTYDVRFWPNKEINKASLEIIKNKKYPKDFDMFWFNKTAERIEKILEETDIDEFWQEFYRYVKKGCCEKAKSWWSSLTNWYKKRIEEGIEHNNRFEIKDWLVHAKDVYQDYCLFCKHAEIKPEEMPDFIIGAEDILNKLEEDNEKEIDLIEQKGRNEKKEEEQNEKYIIKYPDKYATGKQIAFIKKLMQEKNYSFDSNLSNLTRKEASKLINKLLKM